MNKKGQKLPKKSWDIISNCYRLVYLQYDRYILGNKIFDILQLQTNSLQYLSRRYMAEILPIRRKTLYNWSINQYSSYLLFIIGGIHSLVFFHSHYIIRFFDLLTYFLRDPRRNRSAVALGCRKRRLNRAVILMKQCKPRSRVIAGLARKRSSFVQRP